MSVATTNNRVEATGNGVTTAFPVSFVFNDETDLKVYKAGVLQTLTTHYTVSGGDGFDGTVTFLAAPANGNAIIILRDPPFTQATAFRNQGRFFAEVHEEAFDKLTMIAQRLDDRVDRAAVLPDTVASSVSATLPTPSAGGVLAWNSGATALENGTTVGAINSAAANAAAAAASAAAAATSETNAATSATNAASSATAAASSAAAAQAAADSIGFRDVVFITSADSPYTVAQATSGKLVSIDTSSGAVTVNLPQISTLTLPFTVGIKKTTGDANNVTINRAGTDTFDDGSTSKTLSSIAGTTLIPDTDPTPDKWTASDWGASTGQQKKQQFVGGVDFTAGVTTTLTITETPIPSSKDALEVFFDGAYQQESEWEYNASTGVITFDVAIPGGTARVETVWATPLTIGTPADGTVSAAKMAYSSVNGQTAETAPATGDELLLGDVSAAALRKMTLENLLKVINVLTEDASPDAAADYGLAYDASASAVKKVLLARMGKYRVGPVSINSGTTNDVTGVPSWVTRITISYANLSTNGTSNYLLQLGDSGGIEPSGYAGNANNPPGALNANATNGFTLYLGPGAANVTQGYVILTLIDPATNLWECFSSFGRSDTSGYTNQVGTKSLSAVLDRFRTTSVTPDTFDGSGVFSYTFE